MYTASTWTPRSAGATVIAMMGIIGSVHAGNGFESNGMKVNLLNDMAVQAFTCRPDDLTLAIMCDDWTMHTMGKC
jgi:hypothetical protein